MKSDLENYIKELVHRKKLGLISNDEITELDRLLNVTKNMESSFKSENVDKAPLIIDAVSFKK